MEKIFSKRIIWFLIPVFCLVLAVIAFFAIYRSSTSSGLNTDLYIKGGNTVTVSVGTDAVVNYDANVDKIKVILENNGIKDAFFELSTRTYDDQAKIIVSYVNVKGADMTAVNSKIVDEIKDAYKDIATVEDYVSIQTVSGKFNDSVILNALLAFGIAFLLIYAYMFVRYGWANALSGLISSLVVGVIVVSLIVITHTPISSSVLGLIAFALVLTAVVSIVLFDKITYNAKKSGFKGGKSDAENIIGLSVKQIFKVSLYLYVFIMLAAIALLITGLAFNIKLSVGAALTLILTDIAVCYAQFIFTPCLSSILMSTVDKKNKISK